MKNKSFYSLIITCSVFFVTLCRPFPSSPSSTIMMANLITESPLFSVEYCIVGDSLHLVFST